MFKEEEAQFAAPNGSTNGIEREKLEKRLREIQMQQTLYLKSLREQSVPTFAAFLGIIAFFHSPLHVACGRSFSDSEGEC